MIKNSQTTQAVSPENLREDAQPHTEQLKPCAHRLAEYVQSLPENQHQWWYLAMQLQWLCREIDAIRSVTQQHNPPPSTGESREQMETVNQHVTAVDVQARGANSVMQGEK